MICSDVKLMCQIYAQGINLLTVLLEYMQGGCSIRVCISSNFCQALVLCKTPLTMNVPQPFSTTHVETKLGLYRYTALFSKLQVFSYPRRLLLQSQNPSIIFLVSYFPILTYSVVFYVACETLASHKQLARVLKVSRWTCTR